MNPQCEKCRGNGVLQLGRGKGVEWCDCEIAQFVKERAPNFVTDWNERRSRGELTTPAAQRARELLESERARRIRRVIRNTRRRDEKFAQVLRNWGV